MTRKARSFVLMALCLSVPSVAFAEKTSCRRYERFIEQEKHVCPCERFSWLNGLQVFYSMSSHFDFFNGEKYVARNIHPNIDALYSAWIENYHVLQRRLNNPLDLYDELIDKEEHAARMGVDFGIRYMFGWLKSAIGISATLGYKSYLSVLVKKGAEDKIKNYYLSNGGDPAALKTIMRVRKEKDANLEDNDITFQLPEKVSATGLTSDILFEFIHSFFGNLLDTEELHRESFCLLTSFGLGARINFKTWAKDDVYEEQPEVNKEFLKDHTLIVVPLIKFGMQFLFKHGFFFDVNFLTQLLPTFGHSDYMREPLGHVSNDNGVEQKNNNWFTKLKVFSSLNPAINFGFGFDFYGLCKGEKLEDYYDN